jgi:hypothetical protein
VDLFALTGAVTEAVSASLRTSPQPIIYLMLAGFGIGGFGYLSGSKILVGLGVAIVFVAGLLAPQY